MYGTCWCSQFIPPRWKSSAIFDCRKGTLKDEDPRKHSTTTDVDHQGYQDYISHQFYIDVTSLVKNEKNYKQETI